MKLEKNFIKAALKVTKLLLLYNIFEDKLNFKILQIIN
jgi:hypothetical protein